MQRGKNRGVERQVEVSDLVEQIPSRLGEMSGEQQVNFAENLAEKCKGVSASKIRNIYNGILKIRRRFEEKEKSGSLNEGEIRRLISELHLLRAKIAYFTGRSKGKEKQGLESFKKSYEKMVESVSSEEDLRTIFDIMESIVAFHKYHGGA